MRTTSWHRIRRRLKHTSLGLLILCAVLTLFTVRAAFEYNIAFHELAARSAALATLSLELQVANKELVDKKGKIDGLIGTIARQDALIEFTDRKNKDFHNRLFIWELTRQISLYCAKDPAARLCARNPVDIYEMVSACMKYEGVYKKKYPKYKDDYNWMTMVRMLGIESNFELNPKPGPRTELGAPQICEIDTDRRGNRTPVLYSILKLIGAGKPTYGLTIDHYRSDPDTQINAMYQYFTWKLRDTHGDLKKAIVAYNSYYAVPELSPYWYQYQLFSRRSAVWISEARKRTR